jgi:hypothetical protein
MSIITKTVTASVKSATEDEDAPYGAFDVILSAQTKDRDGDVLLKDEWKTPLPDHIPFDIDHGMSIEKTVGSGKPFINDDGNLQVRGTFASTPLGQTVRSLVAEGHIRSTSVAFMSEKTQKDGNSVVLRELLNGAFVNTPSNREAIVLAVKSLDTKAGARNSSSDAAKIQQIYDLAVELGASAGGDDTKSVTAKSISGSLEAAQDRARDALNDAYGTGAWVWLRGTLPDTLIFDISTEDSSDTETYQQGYTDNGSVVTLTGERTAVDLTEVVKPDPDEDAADSGATDAPASGAAKSAPVAGAKAAPVEDADSDAVTDEEIEAKALQILAAQFI